MIVLKFGGTSVASAEAITRVADIVAGRMAERPVVVVSAMGKTTDRLLELMGQAGFEGAHRLDDRFYQPVLVGTKPA